jgi:acetyltransferase-like isoleucine patch superfamily enzyme
MASVGFGTTIGAGTVVVRPIANQVVAVGNPARVIKEVCPDSRE